jgi:hypothetical protein
MVSLEQFVRYPLAAAMLAAMGSPAGACADEHGPCAPAGAAVVSMEQLPPAAAAGIAGAAPGARVQDVLSFEDAGRAMYLARTVRAGRAMGVQVGATGEVVLVETRLSASELPGPVKRTADAEVGTYALRDYWKRERRDGTGGAGATSESYVVRASSRARVKSLEIAPDGGVVSSTFETVEAPGVQNG